MSQQPRESLDEPISEELSAVGTQRDSSVAVASQWQLMRWKFFRHRLAVAGLAVIVALYMIAIFGDFVAPYDPQTRFGVPFAPPQLPRFFTEQGFTFQPVVNGLQSELDLQTFQRIYTPDPSQTYKVRFFVRGEPYKFLGLFESNLHLFGAEEGGHVFLMGTDRLGRDVFSRVVYGARISLSIGLVGVALSLILGIILGGASGYFGGAIDNIVQRSIEILRSFPTIPLWMALAAAVPSRWSPVAIYFSITVILSLVGWTDLARVVRGRFLSLRNEDFVLAARLAGLSEAQIILRHLLPSFYSHIIASITLSIPSMILAETSLSFLGLGLQPPVVSWGVLLQDAQNVHAVAMAPWLLLPGAFVILSVLAFNFAGDGLRDAADPYAETG